MTDIILETIRAFIVGFIFLYLLCTGRKEKIHMQKGWSFILLGFALLFLGMIIDITDNFPVLDRYIVIGDTEVQAFIEKVAGYLCGFLLLAVGFWKWMPMVIALKKVERALEGSRDELELLVNERTTELVAINEELESEITERYRVENALRKSEGKYQSLIANIPSVTWITDINGNTSFISPNVKDIYGYTPAEIYEAGGSLLFNRMHKDDIQTVKKAYEDLFSKNCHFDAEYRTMKKDGQWIWLHDRAVTTFEKDGKTYAYGVFTDITRRKRVEQELEHREIYWRTLIENTMDIITILDSSGTIEYVSPSVESVLGYTPEEHVGKNAVEFVHLDDKTKALEALQRAITIPGHSESLEVSYLHKNGPWRTLSVRGKNFQDNNGKEKIILNSRDITERKNMEEALQKNEEKYRRVVEGTNDAIVSIDSLSNITAFNRGAEKILGYKAEEVIGKPEVLLVPDELIDDQESIIQKVREAGFVTSYETVRMAKDGTRITVDMTLSVIRDNEGKVIGSFAIFRDITERKKTEEAIKKSEIKLKSIFRAAPIGIGLASNRIIKQVNKRMCEITGYSREDLLEQTARMLYLTQEAFNWVGSEKYKQVLKHGTGTVETRWKRKDGSIINVLLSSTPLDPADLSAGVTFTALDITKRKRMEGEREELITELKDTLAEVKTLSGMLPICSSCKKIRNDGGYWEQVEVYIHEHSEAEFSHGICPECAKKLYPKYFKDTEQKK